MEKKSIQVGDLLHGSWGYNMTFNEFFRVIERRGKSTIVAQKLSNEKISGGGSSGKEIPGAPTGEVITFRESAKRPGSVKYSDHCRMYPSNEGREYYYNTMD